MQKSTRWIAGPALALSAWALGFWMSGFARTGAIRNPPPAALTTNSAIRGSHLSRVTPSASPEAQPLSQRLDSALAETNQRRRRHSLDVLVESLQAADCAQAVDLARPLLRGDRLEFLPRVMARWAELNPRAAAAAAAALSGPPTDSKALEGALSVWAANDADAAVAWATALPTEENRKRICGVLSTILARRRPATALRLWEEAGYFQRNFYEQPMTDLISHWARRRPHEAAEALEKLPGGFVSDHARQTLAEWWARDDPAAALGWARQIEDPVRRRDVVLSALASWADTGTHAATNYALGLPAGHERDEALLVIAPRIAQQNLEEALQLVEQISDRPEPRTEDSFSFGTRREDALYMIVQTLSKTDPETAASLIARLPPGDARNNAADQVAQNWPGEYSAGLEWARALPPNHARERAIEGFLRRWSQHDAKAALSWMIQNEPPGPNGWGADEHLRALGEQNGAEIIEWLRIFPDGATKRMLLNTAIDGLARSDPERAAELFTTELSPDAQSRVADNLTYQWARKEPASAAAWTLQFPEGKTRAEAAYGVAAIWSETDPAQTAAWLERLPPGETRERAVLTFAGKVAEADPESALTWMLTLTDNKARDAAMEPALEHWMTRDHAAAQRWMERNPTVPAEMRERLRRSKP